MTSNTGNWLEKLKQKPVIIVILLMLAYAAYFSYFTIMKHQTFHSFAYDLGIFTQYMWTTLNGHGVLYAPLLESSVWSWHVQPILFFILPIYAVFPHAETLLVLQSSVMALGALPVYLIARDELGAKFGVVFAALYLLYPALHGVNSFDFHPVALAIPILLFCFYMFQKKRYVWGMILAVLAMMCKENVALVVVFMGFYWLWKERKGGGLDWRRLPREREVLYPLCLSALGIIWLVLAIYVIIPHFSLSGEYPWFTRYSYGNTFGNIFGNADAKLWYLFYLFGPLTFTPLLSPVTLIALPAFAQNLSAVDKNMYSILFQYPSLLIPWLFIGGIYGFKWLSTVKGKVVQAIRTRFIYILVPAAVVIALLVSPSPIALDYDMPRITSHHRVVQQAISLIPEDASVYAQNDLLPHVAQRLHAYSHTVKMTLDFFDPFATQYSKGNNEFYDGNYDYILADETSEQSILRWGSQESLERLESEYGIYAQGDGVYLYQKGYNGEPIPLGEE
jgi:uncharacterized membrane protein